MIVHEHACIFVHIPKTAGVSLTHAIISQVVGKDLVGEIGKLPNTIKSRFSLRNAQKHKQAMFYVPDDISKELWNKYYKFAFVRNPWDRVISEFHWRHSLTPSRYTPSTNFEEFITYCKFRIDGSSKARRDIYWSHAQMQKSYVTNKEGELILDDVFHFEYINDAIEKIQTKINVPLKIKRYNASKHNHYRQYYNDKTKKMVYNLYKDDIEMFGYEF